ncbi:MAG TPA: DUF6090 family protein [Cryomorphaceae bacterium]|nr:DUF6090 family protein [Cryomorphaceae bacterium]
MESKTSKPASSTGRYLKYAIGEIVLVVIGILIALQINTWNEGRKAKVNEVKVVKALIADAEADSVFYTSRVELFASQIEVYQKIADLCSRGEFTAEDSIPLQKIYRPFILAANYSDVIHNNIDVMEVISGDSIKHALRDYYKSFVFITTAIEISNSISKEYGDFFGSHYEKVSRFNTPDALIDYKGFCETENVDGILVLLMNRNRNAKNQAARFLRDNAILRSKLSVYLEEL